MKKFFVILSICFAVSIAGCKSGDENEETSTEATSESTPSATESNATTDNGNPSYDPNRGEGKFKDVKVEDKLNTAMAEVGQKVYDVKCSSCHKLTSEKLVGPGWAGVTTRRKPEWIMNFVTNTDEMITKDPAAQAMLEICLVRMPNQNLTDDEARGVLEFMRKNDGVK
jgi:cytochrome c2